MKPHCMVLCQRLLPALLGCALTACASAPAQFYTLLPAGAATGNADATYVIDVQPVSVPVSVDRPQLVVRQSDNSVALLENQRWIAPLADELRSALSVALSQRLHTRDVHELRITGNKPVYDLRVDVQRFESVYASHSLLGADWSVHKRGTDDTAQSCSSLIRESVTTAGYSALVSAQQQAVQQLAAQIASVLRGLAAGHPVGCPQADSSGN